MKIAAVQMDVRLGDLAGNAARVAERLKETAAAGAVITVFPECVLPGYCFASQREAWPYALELPAAPAAADRLPRVLQPIAQLCAVHDCFAVLGLLESAGGHLFNSAVMLGPAGLQAAYRKTHLPAIGVDRFTAAGNELSPVHLVETREGAVRVSIGICYDMTLPEPVRVLTLRGAELIVLPTNWPAGAETTAVFLSSARALENKVYLAAADRVGTESGTRFVGLSRICGLNGTPLAAVDHAEEAILYAEIDPALARDKRVIRQPGVASIHRLHDRRPELYGPLVAPVDRGSDC